MLYRTSPGPSGATLPKGEGSIIISIQSSQVQTSRAAAGLEGGHVQIVPDHPVHLSGVLGGEIQPQTPQSQAGQILPAVEQTQLLAVEQHTAAGTAVLDDGEFQGTAGQYPSPIASLC